MSFGIDLPSPSAYKPLRPQAHDSYSVCATRLIATACQALGNPDVVIILPICPKIWQLNLSLREESSMLISRGSLHPTFCTKIASSSSLKPFDSVASGTRRMV
jgi:hypothetical protein